MNYVVLPERACAKVALDGRFQELRINIPLQKAQWVSCTSTGAIERSLLNSLYYPGYYPGGD